MESIKARQAEAKLPKWSVSNDRHVDGMSVLHGGGRHTQLTFGALSRGHIRNVLARTWQAEDISLEGRN